MGPVNGRRFEIRSLALAAALCTLLAGCQSTPAEGEYVDFVRELMVESARLEGNAGEGPDRSETAERAVRVWREGDDEDDN